MCIEYARTVAMNRLMHPIERVEITHHFEWVGAAPSPNFPQFHIQIGDKAIIARREGRHLAAEMMTWGWKEGRHIVFNMKSENRDFSQAFRILILATGFYEDTEPADLGKGRRERHLFTMRGEEWFWIAGIAAHDGFAMLTTRASSDIKPYHNRQLCLLPPSAGMAWLTLVKPQKELLGSLPEGRLAVRTLGQIAIANDTRY